MQKPVHIFLVIFFVLIFSSSLSARIFKYIDENGQKRWTDDLSQVPIEQRESAEHFEDVGDHSQEGSTNPEESHVVTTPSTDQSEDNADLTREALLNEKSALEEQYQLLVEQRKQIEQMKAEKGDASHRMEINEKIAAYNANHQQYEAQLNAYKAKIEAYKKKIIPSNDAQSP